MKFVAKRMGFYAGRRIRAGETFVAEGFKGSWAAPVAAEKAKAEVGEQSPAPSPPTKKRKKAKKSAASKKPT